MEDPVHYPLTRPRRRLWLIPEYSPNLKTQRYESIVLDGKQRVATYNDKITNNKPPLASRNRTTGLVRPVFFFFFFLFSSSLSIEYIIISTAPYKRLCLLNPKPADNVAATTLQVITFSEEQYK